MSNLDQLIDHAANLQQQVDRLWLETLALWVSLAALATIVCVQAWQLKKG